MTPVVSDSIAGLLVMLASLDQGDAIATHHALGLMVSISANPQRRHMRSDWVVTPLTLAHGLFG